MSEIKIDGKRYECAVDDCDFWMVLSYDAILRGEEQEALSNAYKLHDKSIGHKEYIIEVIKDDKN